MSFLADIFNQIFYRPLFNILVLLYLTIPGKNLGVAVLLLTLLIRILLYPLNQRGIKSQQALTNLEPKIKEIRKKFKNDPEKITKETLQLYQKEKINPFSGVLLLLVQLPVLIALYMLFAKAIFDNDFGKLYSFVPNPG